MLQGSHGLLINEAGDVVRSPEKDKAEPEIPVDSAEIPEHDHLHPSYVSNGTAGRAGVDATVPCPSLLPEEEA